MYGNCKICGKMHGTMDGKYFAPACEHVKAEVLAIMEKRKMESNKDYLVRKIKDKTEEFTNVEAGLNMLNRELINEISPFTHLQKIKNKNTGTLALFDRIDTFNLSTLNIHDWYYYKIKKNGDPHKHNIWTWGIKDWEAVENDQS